MGHGGGELWLTAGSSAAGKGMRAVGELSWAARAARVGQWGHLSFFLLASRPRPAPCPPPPGWGPAGVLGVAKSRRRGRGRKKSPSPMYETQHLMFV